MVSSNRRAIPGACWRATPLHPFTDKAAEPVLWEMKPIVQIRKQRGSMMRQSLGPLRGTGVVSQRMSSSEAYVFLILTRFLLYRFLLCAGNKIQNSPAYTQHKPLESHLTCLPAPAGCHVSTIPRSYLYYGKLMGLLCSQCLSVSLSRGHGKAGAGTLTHP